jgi:hypothetical protein
MFLFGRYGLMEWQSERAALIACSVAWAVAGPATFLAAVWVFGSLGRNPLPLRIGGPALVACGVVLILAAWTNVMCCSTPT